MGERGAENGVARGGDVSWMEEGEDGKTTTWTAILKMKETATTE